MTGGWPDLDRACPGGHLGSPNAFTPWRSCFDVVATTDELQIVDRGTVTPVAAEHHHGLKGELRPKGTTMSVLSNLHQRAAEHHEHAARHHREAAKFHELKDLVAAADQAHMAADHQEHAIHYATKAAKEYIAQRQGR